MIARLWSAQTTLAQAPAYAEHLQTKVLPILRKLHGYVTAMLLKREVAENAEIIVITWWHSLDAVRQFTGEDFEAAIVADEAAALLTAFDVRVRHYDLALGDAASAPGI